LIRIAWAGLKQRFEPDNGAMKVQMKSEFQDMKLLRAEDDPDPWITKVDSLRRRLCSLGVTISDEDAILHILNNITKEYATTIEICEEDLTGSQLTLQLLKDRVRAKFRRIQKEQMESSESIAIMARSFKGMCNVCGIIGHKGADCFKLEKHKEKKEAFMKKRNKNSTRHRKPKYNKAFRHENHQPTRDVRNQRDNSRNNRSSERNQETARMARYNGFMLIASKCEGIDSNTWIADTGASIENIPHVHSPLGIFV
jgi:gag-polypeptide of LTR copia-type